MGNEIILQKPPSLFRWLLVKIGVFLLAAVLVLSIAALLLGAGLAMLGWGTYAATTNIEKAMEIKCPVSVDGEFRLDEGFSFPKERQCVASHCQNLTYNDVKYDYTNPNYPRNITKNETGQYVDCECVQYNETYLEIPPFSGKGKVTAEVPCFTLVKDYYGYEIKSVLEEVR